jgi:hypothetical protein
MTETTSTDTLVRLLSDAGEAGLTGSELMRSAQMTTEAFEKEVGKLWIRQRLTGVREDRCCRRGCGFMCVSYMELDRVWRLKEPNK